MERKTSAIVILLAVISVLAVFAVFYATPQLDIQVVDEVFIDEVSISKPYKIEIISEPNPRFAELGIIRVIGLERRKIDNEIRTLGYGDALAAGLREVDSKYSIVDIIPIDYRGQSVGGGSETVELIVLIDKAK